MPFSWDWDQDILRRPADELAERMAIFSTRISDVDDWRDRLDDPAPLLISQCRRLAEAWRATPEYVRDLHLDHHRAAGTPPRPVPTPQPGSSRGNDDRFRKVRYSKPHRRKFTRAEPRREEPAPGKLVTRYDSI
jgi:hypothetical protein